MNWFDDTTEPIVNASDFRGTIKGFPRVAVAAFAPNLMPILARREEYVPYEGYEGNFDHPIYRTEVRGVPVAVCCLRVGAPAAAMALEELYALGAQGVVAYGCCGVLDREIAAGGLIIPTTAVREEGTSHHYLPPGEEIEQPEESVALLRHTFDRHMVPYGCGKTWTTDGFYRETRKKAAEMRGRGCICVEMECSALLAVAKHRNRKLAQFVYAADNLDGDAWDARTLGKLDGDGRLRYLSLALEAALEMENTLLPIEGGIA